MEVERATSVERHVSDEAMWRRNETTTMIDTPVKQRTSIDTTNEREKRRKSTINYFSFLSFSL
jgi:hypothetical protein